VIAVKKQYLSVTTVETMVLKLLVAVVVLKLALAQGKKYDFIDEFSL